MPVAVNICNAYTGTITVRFGIDKQSTSSDNNDGGATGGVVKSRNECRLKDIGSGNDMDFSTLTPNAYLTIWIENGRELCVDKEVNNSFNFIVDSQGHLLSSQIGSNRWIDIGYKLSYEEDDISKTSDETFSDQGLQINERRVLFIGKTGVGKSTTANTVLGEQIFSDKVSARSITKISSLAKHNDRFGRKLVIVDTPGLCDTNKTFNDDGVMEEIKKFYGMTAPGLHAVILVVNVGRFGEEEEKTVELFKKHFGEELMEYLIVVFAGKDALEAKDTDIKDYISTYETNSSMRKLLDDIKNRYVVFGFRRKYDIDKKERDEEVNELLDLIDTMVEINGERCYTNEEYEKAEKLVQKEMERRLKHTHPTLFQQFKRILGFGSKKSEIEKGMSSEAYEALTKDEMHEEVRKQMKLSEESSEQQMTDEITNRHKALIDEFKNQEGKLNALKKQLDDLEVTRQQDKNNGEKIMRELRDQVRVDIEKKGSSCVIQ